MNLKNTALPLLLLILAVTILTACYRNTPSPSVYWASLGHETDSLTHAVETKIISGDRPDEVNRDITEMSRHARTPLQRKRVLYFKAWAASETPGTPLDSSGVRNLLTGLDSARFPYDWHRYSDLTHSLLTAPLSVKFRHYHDAALFYEGVRDTASWLNALNRLGKIYMLTDNDSLALNTVNEGIRLSTSPRFKSFLQRNLLNQSVLLLKHSDTLRAVRNIRLLEKSSLIHDQPRIAPFFFSHAYQATADPQYLYKALRHDSLEWKIPNRLAFHYIGKNNDSVVKYARISFERALRSGTDEQLVDAYHLKYLRERILGNKDSAFHYVDLWLNKYETLMARYDSDRVTRLQADRQLKEEIMKRTADAQREKYFWRLIMLTLAFIAVAAWLLIRVKIKNLKLIASRREADLEQYRRREMAKAVCNRKYKTDLEHFIRCIEEMEADNTLRSDTARILKKKVKRQFADDPAWNSFISTFENIRPEFTRHLTRLYPAITPTMLETALYTRMGLSGKQLASILGIDYNAVKKRRHNLRRLLGLSTRDSLEKHLEKLDSQSRQHPL